MATRRIIKLEIITIETGRLVTVFLKLLLSGKLVFAFACMCLPQRLLITSGMIWISYDWLNKFYSFYMAAVVGIISRHGLRNQRCYRNPPK